MIDINTNSNEMVNCSLNVLDYLTFVYLFSNTLLVFRAGVHKKMRVIITNREDPDQTASSEAV